jgi:hypothetical protein
MSYFDSESVEEVFEQWVGKGPEPEAPGEVPEKPEIDPGADGSDSDPDEDIPAIPKGKPYIFTALFQPVLTIGGPEMQSENLESGSDVAPDVPPVEVGKSYIFTALFQLVLTIGGPEMQSENLESGSDVAPVVPPVEVGK